MTKKIMTPLATTGMALAMPMTDTVVTYLAVILTVSFLYPILNAELLATLQLT